MGEGAAWGERLRAAARLRISPEAFWRLSLREWRMLTAGEVGPVLGREEFEGLAARYPDGG
jgi:uncharacterized phage protein (TIGR02216 family)